MSAITPEVAEAEFQRFLDTMYLRFDVNKMDAEDRTSFQLSHDILIGAMLDGRLVVNDKGEPVFSPRSGGDPVTFFEPTGQALLAMDQHKKNQDGHKGFAAMSSATKTSIQRFSAMPVSDLRVCQHIMLLFLTSA